MKFPLPPRDRGLDGKTKKTRQQSVRHISLDLDLDLYLSLKIDTLPYLSTYLLYGKVR